LGRRVMFQVHWLKKVVFVLHFGRRLVV